MQEVQKETIVLAQDEYAMWRDRSSSGLIKLCVGPCVFNPKPTDEPIRFTKEGGFEVCRQSEAIRKSIFAPENHYVELFNPTLDGQHPRASSQDNVPIDLRLDAGRRVNIPGPTNFALWPGQFANMIRGHQLRSNQYLVIRITDEEQARANWTASTVKIASGDGEGGGPGKVETPNFGYVPGDLAVGKRYIIKGTDVSFYIPPTGVSVERTNDGAYVRSALSLERLEYCILIAEDGNKRYERGPAVVFPTPTEQFLKIKGDIKFRAIELNEIQLLHIKVIDTYEENGVVYKEGQEIVITGKDQAIYFPRPEHALLTYDGNAKHFATAVPAGHARYVLERMTSEINVVKGPKMLLPDPRSQVIVRRALSDEEVKLWYPGNVARGDGALEYNRALRALEQQTPTTRPAVSEGEITRSKGKRLRSATRTTGITGEEFDDAAVANHAYYSTDSIADVAMVASVDSVQGSEKTFSSNLHMERANHGNQKPRVADQITRGSSYTAPRTITLNNKLDGVPVIQPHNGYAVQVVDNRGSSRVEQGPTTIHLEYDEVLRPFMLSTGTPKNHDKTVKDVYLQVKNNQVSDEVFVMTQDHVRVQFKLSYRVDFEGDPSKWFMVENYVKLLTDHCRSVMMGFAKRTPIAELYQNGVDMVRDWILGEKLSDVTKEIDIPEALRGSRPGMFFEDNNMRIKDVEILDIDILTHGIADLFDSAQTETVKNNIDLERSNRHYNFVSAQEAISRDLETEKAKTAEHKHTIQLKAIDAELALKIAGIASETEQHKKSLERATAQDERKQFEFEADAARQKAAAELSHTLNEKIQSLTLERIKAETEAAVKRLEAVAVHFTGALTTLSNNESLRQLSEASLVTERMFGMNLQDILRPALQGTRLENFFFEKVNAPTNGQNTTTRTS